MKLIFVRVLVNQNNTRNNKLIVLPIASYSLLSVKGVFTVSIFIIVTCNCT